MYPCKIWINTQRAGHTVTFTGFMLWLWQTYLSTSQKGDLKTSWSGFVEFLFLCLNIVICLKESKLQNRYLPGHFRLTRSMKKRLDNLLNAGVMHIMNLSVFVILLLKLVQVKYLGTQVGFQRKWIKELGLSSAWANITVL